MNHDEAPMYFDEEDEETQLISRCHHEAAHAVFAYHAGLKIFSVVAAEEGGTCEIDLPEYRNGVRRENSRVFVSRERTRQFLPRHSITRTQRTSR